MNPSAAPRTNRVEELANALQREGRLGELERELKKLDASSLSPAEHEAWWHFYGIVAFREGRDGEALERLQEAHRRFPGSASIRFSLGQQYIRAKDVEKGFELFRTCRFPEIPREYALAQARYAYLWSRYDDGLSFIRPFYKAYQQLKILDDHFLYIRGLPFFGRWWSHMAAFAILSGDLRELESATEYVIENCHDYDFDCLKAELEAHRDRKTGRLLEALEKTLGRMPQGFPTGYTRMNMAVLRAQAAATIGGARGILEGVALSPQDFPWLEDIRTLAMAETAHRLGDPGLEREKVEAFQVRQPMLFEPDIALNFHLLRYQERLKPGVIAR